MYILKYFKLIKYFKFLNTLLKQIWDKLPADNC